MSPRRRYSAALRPDPKEAETVRRTTHGRLLRALTSTLVLALLAALLLAGPAFAAGKPGKPTAKSPKGTVTTAKPTLRWSKAWGAAKYELRIYKGMRLLLKKTGLRKTTWRAVKAPPSGVTLTWKVRASNARGTGAWSKGLEFRVAGTRTRQFEAVIVNGK